MPVKARDTKLILNRKETSTSSIQQLIRSRLDPSKLRDYALNTSHFTIPKAGLDQLVELVDDFLALFTGFNAPNGERPKRYEPVSGHEQIWPGSETYHVINDAIIGLLARIAHKVQRAPHAIAAIVPAVPA